MPESPETLERTAADHRAKLGDVLAALSKTIDPDRLGQEMRATTGDLSQTLVSNGLSAAKRNPAGLALLVLGAAVLTLKPSGKEPARPADPGDLPGHDARIAAADARMAAKDRIRQSGGSAMSSRGMRKWLDSGLDKLGPEARDRVVAARLKAIDAQEMVERQAAKAAEAARDAHDAQPLVTTLAVAGVGALIGALLPSTRAESDLMGARRDQMLRHADSVLRAEMEALQDRGETALRSGLEAARNELSAERQG